MLSVELVKYFFLSEGWTHERVWEFGGLWDYASWRRKPEIKRLNLAVVEKGQVLWLYQAEEAVLMIEVVPTEEVVDPGPFGQVVLKRLISAEQVIERLEKAEKIINE